MRKLVFDGKNMVLGRLGSLAAKELLKGNSVNIINSSEVIISGKIESFVERIKVLRRKGRGGSLKGPKYNRRSDLLLKRILRGMLPWDRQKGRDAYKRLRCYSGEEELKDVEKRDIKIKHLPRKYFKLGEAISYLK